MGPRRTSGEGRAAAQGAEWLGLSSGGEGSRSISPLRRALGPTLSAHQAQAPPKSPWAGGGGGGGGALRQPHVPSSLGGAPAQTPFILPSLGNWLSHCQGPGAASLPCPQHPSSQAGLPPGPLGHHFPPRPPECKGVSSLQPGFRICPPLQQQ